MCMPARAGAVRFVPTIHIRLVPTIHIRLVPTLHIRLVPTLHIRLVSLVPTLRVGMHLAHEPGYD